jgi:hypothetical protein
MAETTGKGTKIITPNAAFVKMLTGLLASSLLTVALLFAAAGRLDWALGWLFIAAWSVLKLVFIILLRWRDPDLIVERVTRHENTKPYDRLILPIYFAVTE